MHELSIAQSILDIVAEQMRHHQGARVTVVNIKLGACAGVIREALISAYGIAREVSPAPESNLVIQDIPVTVMCPSCNAPREIESIQDFRCRQCGTLCGDVLTGREMEITSIEILE